MASLKLQNRPYEGIIVVRDAGIAHPTNDIDGDRAFNVGEQISVRLDHAEPLRQQSLHADVVGVDERGIVARARHPVYRADPPGSPDDPIVFRGQEFIVPRECVFTVTKTSAPSQVPEATHSVPPSKSEAQLLANPPDSGIFMSETGSFVMAVPLVIPPGIRTQEERLKMTLDALIVSALRVVDFALSEGEGRDLVSSKDVVALRKLAERIERLLRGGDI